MEGIKPKNTKENEFESWEDSMLITQFGLIFRTLGIEINPKIGCFWSSSSTTVEILIDKLMEKIKPVDSIKTEFEDRDKSKLLVFFGILELLNSDT